MILRETLAFHSPLADFAFAMQGLGSGAITLAARPQQAAYLPRWRARQDRGVCAERADAGSGCRAENNSVSRNHQRAAAPLTTTR